jgi:hypothetical protein
MHTAISQEAPVDLLDLSQCAAEAVAEYVRRRLGPDCRPGTASIRTAPQIVVGAPPNFDVTPDGTAFVMVSGERREPWLQIDVVLNWFEELKKATERDRPEG